MTVRAVIAVRQYVALAVLGLLGLLGTRDTGERDSITRKQHSSCRRRRTRVFVRMPGGEILPADLDLNWTIAQASDYIIATWNCLGIFSRVAVLLQVPYTWDLHV